MSCTYVQYICTYLRFTWLNYCSMVLFCYCCYFYYYYLLLLLLLLSLLLVSLMFLLKMPLLLTAITIIEALFAHLVVTIVVVSDIFFLLNFDIHAPKNI